MLWVLNQPHASAILILPLITVRQIKVVSILNIAHMIFLLTIIRQRRMLWVLNQPHASAILILPLITVRQIKVVSILNIAHMIFLLTIIIMMYQQVKSTPRGTLGTPIITSFSHFHIHNSYLSN